MIETVPAQFSLQPICGPDWERWYYLGARPATQGTVYPRRKCAFCGEATWAGLTVYVETLLVKYPQF